MTVSEQEKGDLPCPFCGSANTIAGGDDKICGIFCSDCGASGPNGYQSDRHWNDRHPQAYEAAKPVPASGGVEAASGIGLRIAAKYAVGGPGIRLAKEIADAISAERAALASSPATTEGVRAKPLVWSERTSLHHIAETPFGAYSVYCDGGWSGPASAGNAGGSFAEGRVAAQADYESRILSALSPAPAATSASETRSDALANLISVLCDPDGRVCIEGSDVDRAAVKASLETLAEVLK